MFPSCQQCGSPTRPATADEAAIFGPIGALPGMMTWKCSKCGSSFVRPLQSHQAEEVRRHFRHQAKRWWQFWKRG
jgi:hypothetical protein